VLEKAMKEKEKADVQDRKEQQAKVSSSFLSLSSTSLSSMLLFVGIGVCIKNDKKEVI
jgi:hypothetical protein